MKSGLRSDISAQSAARGILRLVQCNRKCSEFYLQCFRLQVILNSGTKEHKTEEAEGEGSCQAHALLKLLVKDKLPHSREVPVNAKEWQLKPPRREKNDCSG